MQLPMLHDLRSAPRPVLASGRTPILVILPPRAATHPGEVALQFRVDPRTVTRWASAGRIGSIRTPGGHRRFRELEVNDLLAHLTFESSQPTA